MCIPAFSICFSENFALVIFVSKFGASVVFVMIIDCQGRHKPQFQSSPGVRHV